MVLYVSGETKRCWKLNIASHWIPFALYYSRYIYKLRRLVRDKEVVGNAVCQTAQVTAYRKGAAQIAVQLHIPDLKRTLDRL